MSESARREPLFTGYSGRLLLALSIGYLGIQFGRNVLSPLLPTIIEELAISPFQAGVALTLLSAAYALCMFPGGRLSDRLSRKTVLVTASVVSVVGFGLLAITTSYPIFLLAAITVGTAAGLYWISLRALLADLYVARRGQAFGIQDAVGFAGPLLAAGGAIAVLAIATWRAAFFPLAVVLVVLVALSHRWINEPYVFDRVEFDLHATSLRVFGTPQIRWLVIAYTCVVFSLQAVIGFLPTFLQVDHGLSPTLASVGFGVLFCGAVVTMPVAGYLGDRTSHAPVAVGGLVLGAAGLLALLFAPSVQVAFAGIFFFAAGAWAFPPVIQAFLMTEFPDASMGGDFGAFKTIYAGVGSLGPAYVGLVAGIESYTLAFTGLTACLLVAILVTARVA